MRYDFDTPINRRNTFSFKWDCDMDYFGRDDVIPMWVADMDFACAPCIVEAVQKRAAHPVYGYGVRQQPYYDAVMGWLKKRHGFEVNYEHLAFAPPGVIYAMNVVLRIPVSYTHLDVYKRQVSVRPEAAPLPKIYRIARRTPTGTAA